jgi:hypothetical protein
MMIYTKYRRTTLTGHEPSFMCDTSSYFPLGPLVYVSTGLLRARVAFPLQCYWLLNLFNCPTVTATLFVRGSGRNWPAGLVTTGCLVVWLGLWQPWHPFRNSTELMSLDTLTSSLSVSTANSYTALAYSKHHLLLFNSFYANTHFKYFWLLKCCD